MQYDFGFYFRLGWAHIISLDAQDHLLFLLALVAVYTLADWRRVAFLVTAFTIGHSATLFLSTVGWLTLPTQLVEFLIPCTIILTAARNLFQKPATRGSARTAYFLALLFGFIHGMGFANTLRFILAGDQSLGWAIFGFNLGLEAGQILIVCLLLCFAHIFVHYFKAARRDWIVALSAAAGSLAIQMAVQRWPTSG